MSTLFKKFPLVLFALIVLVFIFSCKKSWLDAKPDNSLIVPTTIQDFQSLLDNNTGSGLFNTSAPNLTEISCGDSYLLYSNWQALPNIQERNAYIWSKDIFANETSYDWNSAYKRILNSNVALEGVNKIARNQSNHLEWDNVRGNGLFYRANDFFNLLLQFSKSYEKSTATIDLAIPLKLSSNILSKYSRATVQQTYDQIINDLKTSINLLPITPAYLTRASKWSAYALLSRVYLSSDQYQNAFLYADSCLQISNKLIDFNNLSPTSNVPVVRFNVETIFYNTLQSYTALLNSGPRLIVEPNLYELYNSNDLRKVLYFKTVNGYITRKLNYSGVNSPTFGGLATDEILLTRAECNARLNNTAAAMSDLNFLLIKRWKTGTYSGISASSPEDALYKILTERRKELPFRGIRWMDLKRLNKDPRFAVTLIRTLNGSTYTLEPNDPRYVFSLPPDELLLSGI